MKTLLWLFFSATLWANPIEGTIEVSPSLKNKLGPGDTLYIAIRSFGFLQGPPLAAKKIHPVHLPYKFSIGEGDAMIPNTQFVPPYTVEARISKNLNMMRRPGDIMGRTSKDNRVLMGAKNIKIVLDEVVP